MIPCSAATVTGIVCDAASARSSETFSRSTKRSLYEPEPKPCSGRSQNIDRPFSSSSTRPLVARSSAPSSKGSKLSAPDTASAVATTPTRTARGRQLQRPRAPAEQTEHAEPHQQRGEARLGEREQEPGPQQREQRGGPERVAPALGPEQDAGHRDHHDRQEAAVDVGVEEQRVDPEVVLEQVRLEHVRVQQQLTGAVLPEADRDEHDREPDGHAQAGAAAGAGSSRSSRGA